jgi:hypothetical protein
MIERGTVTRPERHEVLRTRQRAERITRMAEHHVKAIQRQLQTRTRADRLLMGPVDLRLMTRRRLKTLLDPGRPPGPGALDITTDRVITALKTVIARQILMNARGQQARLTSQPLIDHGLELIQLRRCPPATISRLDPILQIPLHRPPITSQQPTDLCVGQPLARKCPDVHQLLLADQNGLPTRRQERRQSQPHTRQDPTTSQAPPDTTHSSAPKRSPNTYIFRCASTSIIGCRSTRGVRR